MPESESTTPEAPKRLRAADVIQRYSETIEALVSRSTRGDVAVEFTRNAKGATQIAIKVAAPAGVARDELDALAADVYEVATKLYEDACAKFPTDSGYARNEGQSNGG